VNVEFFACWVAPPRMIRVKGEATTSLTQGESAKRIFGAADRIMKAGQPVQH